MFKLFRRLLPSAPVADEAPARVSRPTPPPLPDELIAPLRRTCWRPNVQAGDDPLRSKFSGTPAATPGEPWPACANCGKPLQLFVQLDPADLPPELTAPWGSGLLQFFYCTSSNPHCEVDCEAYFPFAKSVLLRILEGPVTGAPGPPPPGDFPAKRIVGWNRQDDFPVAEEISGHQLSAEDVDALEASGYPIVGDKLSGWPAWVQGVEYPECPECGGAMTLLFQIDSEDNLPYMFGDAGCGHITYCPTHPRRLAFAWACC